jgi:hypothetical protein
VPEHIKALIVVLGLAVPIFWLARSQVGGKSISLNDFDRRRNLWFAITISSFLIPNFWVFTAISSALIYLTARKDSNSMALFLFVVFSVPPFALTIPGFAGIQQIFSVSHTRTLAIFILLAAYLKLRSQPGVETFGKSLTDKFLIGYLLLPLILQANVDSLTNTIRFGLYSVTDVFLPYYVASRGLKSLAAWKDIFVSFTISAVLLSTVAIFEYARKWPLYGSVSQQMGIDWDFGSFMLRADSLRATATGGHAIVLGYILMVGLAFYAFAKNEVKNKRLRQLLFTSLILGLFATAARGPWIGTVAVFLVLLLTGKNIISRFALISIIAGASTSLLMMTPWGAEFLAYLPFIGTAESDSVIYRQRLFDISIQVIGLNPAFGSFDYMRNPLMQQMLQGQGIIDIVNSYLGVALTYGLVGLGLFIGVFLSGGIKVWLVLRSTSESSEFCLLGRCLLASLAGILITIGTASSVSFVALLYWIVAGLCARYSELSSYEKEFSSQIPQNDTLLPNVRYIHGKI